MSDLTPLDGVRSEHFLNGEDIKPITRKEHFYAGQESKLPEGHQKPETREEWFIKKFRGSSVTVEALTVTENGTYSEEGKAYSPVTVNVDKGLEIVDLDKSDIVSFSDGLALPITSGKFYINAVQSGSGTPSPDNVRPITGFSSMDIVVTPTESAIDGTTYSTTFNDTVYGGYYDSVNGVLTVDKEYRVITSSELITTSSLYVSVRLGESGYIDSSLSQECNMLEFHDGAASSIPVDYFKCINSGGYNRAHMIFCFSDCKGDTADETKNLNEEKLQTLEGEGKSLTVCFGLATPLTIQLTPTLISTLEGTNNIYHNCNGQTEISVLKEA